MKTKLFYIIVIAAVVLPSLVSAATIYDTISTNSNNPGLPNTTYSSSGCQTPQDLAGLFTYSLCLLTYYVTPFLFGLAGVVFIVGIVKYVRAGDNEEKRGQGRDLMWFGIIALFVMITVWGFVNILSRSIFGKDSQLPNLPRQATSVFQQ